jgi:hypothetical protein
MFLSLHSKLEKEASRIGANIGIEMKTFAAPTLGFVEIGLPSNDVKPAAVRVYPVVDRMKISAMEAIFLGVS